MEDLAVDRVLDVHARILRERMGDCRITSEAVLHEMVFRANLVLACIPRAALVFYLLCAYPPFREGNEETAAALSGEILLAGGYRMTGDPAGLDDLAAGIHAFTIEQEDIERWFRENTRESVRR